MPTPSNAQPETRPRQRPRAWITLRRRPPYRSDAFAKGFEALGYVPSLTFPAAENIAPGDVVVVWNLNVRYRPVAAAAKTAGAALIVAENGYIPRAGSMEPFYALARDGHNGAGFWFVGADDRWSALGQTIYPWRGQWSPDSYVLLANQRGIGSELMKCPRDFVALGTDRIKRVYKQAGERTPAVTVREHPGRHKSTVTLKDHFAGARALVTWASNVANLACLIGIPAFRMAPYHVNEAVHDDLGLLPNPPEPDRLAAFRKLAWAQWSLTEIESGAAFRCLLQDIEP